MSDLTPVVSSTLPAPGQRQTSRVVPNALPKRPCVLAYPRLTGRVAPAKGL